MKKHLLSVLGYVVATLVSQGSSHFYFFKQHYAQVPFEKPEPIFALGILSMLIHGGILTYVYAHSKLSTKPILDSLRLTWFYGLFLVSYIALAEAAKYPVPDIASWIGVELLVGSVQFTLVGIVLKLAHRNS